MNDNDETTKITGVAGESKVSRPGSSKDGGNPHKRRKPWKERVRDVKLSRWIRFGIVTVLFVLWVIWMGNPWLGLLWLLLLDIYITGFVPWTWWKDADKSTRRIMNWVDAIFYALTLVYIIFIFVGQQYQIPSSSLEKSLMVGDYLWVNKAIYGPRVPQTPIHFPLVQNMFPIVNTKSYIEGVQLDYHRLPGIRSVERGDIVVFNYPQGDTVALKVPNPDYYQIVYELKRNGIANPQEYIRSNPDKFGEVVWRPVDRRDNYVKRAIGLPGERLAIIDDEVYINGRKIPKPTNVQFNYIVPVSRPIPEDKWVELGVRRDDFGNGPITTDFMRTSFYNVPLTAEMKKEVEKWPEVNGKLIRENKSGMYDLTGVFPLNSDYAWTRDNMGEIWIPKQGSTIHLTLKNLPIYERAIRVYEGNDLEVKDGKIYVNGKQTDYYTFKMDYYWMMGDNRDRSLDSRYWGFVPEDHLVGSPMFVVFSIDGERGGVRGDRFFHDANPDKDSVKW